LLRATLHQPKTFRCGNNPQPKAQASDPACQKHASGAELKYTSTPAITGHALLNREAGSLTHKIYEKTAPGPNTLKQRNKSSVPTYTRNLTSCPPSVNVLAPAEIMNVFINQEAPRVYKKRFFGRCTNNRPMVGFEPIKKALLEERGSQESWAGQPAGYY
jgi:hypothetical protein